MALFATADLHLSFGQDKPMDIFNGWNDYERRLEKNWRAIIKDTDTVVIAGDISWAMKLEDTEADFRFIDSLPGHKIILKGNHDLWWGTRKKVDTFLQEKGINTVSLMLNDSYTIDGVSICGTRGWFYDAGDDADKKVVRREAMRFLRSAELAENKPPIAFLHYPPVFGDSECEEMMQALLDSGIKRCYYGHIHGASAARKAITGEYKGIEFSLISCDCCDFCPVLVR